jgi:antitoxin (DNA-binding transcriptional repressor) of toxin-antitoxin stability system
MFGGIMRRVGLSEAKLRLSELVHRVSRGEHIGITRRGTLAAVPARTTVDLKAVFARIDDIRKTAKPLPKGTTVKDVIEEGRR